MAAPVITDPNLVIPSQADFEKLLKARQEQRDALNKSMIESDSKEERAAIGETLSAIAAEIAEIETMLADPDSIAFAIPKEIEKSTRPTASSRATTGRRMSVTGPFALY